MKVRPRCEAPRREMLYPVNYTPCRYVRISCLRGNPIAIFFIQVYLKFCLSYNVISIWMKIFHEVAKAMI